MRAHRGEGTERVHSPAELDGLQLAAIIKFEEVGKGESVTAGEGDGIESAVRHDVIRSSKAGHSQSEFGMIAVRGLLLVSGADYAIRLAGVVTEITAQRHRAGGEERLLHFE